MSAGRLQLITVVSTYKCLLAVGSLQDSLTRRCKVELSSRFEQLALEVLRTKTNFKMTFGCFIYIYIYTDIHVPRPPRSPSKQHSDYLDRSWHEKMLLGCVGEGWGWGGVTVTYGIDSTMCIGTPCQS